MNTGFVAVEPTHCTLRRLVDASQAKRSLAARHKYFCPNLGHEVRTGTRGFGRVALASG
jgi:hypothetical protein